MSYTAFYRKWRPQTFSEVVGQKNIVQALTNQLKSGRIGHAYLFCGTRGTGKTTIAKIMARAVNCENPQEDGPCNECPTCKAILTGSSVNVVEIDAASNNGVDDIRQIREEVRYAPPQGHYRVYIIDEVHSLTMNAYNALLKTLEEPPAYVMFILATTEAHKIPVTVLSRCQRYDFKRIETDYIYEHLKNLTDREGIAVEDKAIRYIAKAADGGMRDALSLLEQCVSCYYQETLTYDRVLAVLGAVDTSVFTELFSAIVNIDVTAAMKVTAQMVASGKDLTVGVADYIWFLRNMMLVMTSEVTEEELGISTEDLKRLRELAEDVSLDSILRWIKLFSELQAQMKNSTVKRTLLEVAVIRAMKPEEDKDISGLMARIDAAERRLEAMAGGQYIPVAEKAPEQQQPAEELVVELSDEEYDELDLLKQKWGEILGACKHGIAVFMAGATIDRMDGRLTLLLQDDFKAKMMSIENHKSTLVSIIKNKTGLDVDFVCKPGCGNRVIEYKRKETGKVPNWSEPIGEE